MIFTAKQIFTVYVWPWSWSCH